MRFNGASVDILHLSNLEGAGLNALLSLRDTGACYQGSQLGVIRALNPIFNMAERTTIADAWPIRFRQATTPNIPEQNSGLRDSIGIEYEVRSGNYPIIRFTISRCK